MGGMNDCGSRLDDEPNSRRMRKWKGVARIIQNGLPRAVLIFSELDHAGFRTKPVFVGVVFPWINRENIRKRMPAESS